MKRLLVLFSLLTFATPSFAQQPRSHAHAWPHPPSSPGALWQPGLVTSWQWQLSTPVDQSVKVQMYDIDMFDNDATVVAALHAAGRKVVCYVDVGTWENWRSDASKFPKSVLGKNNGWPGEKWFDIRQISILGPLMTARMDQCQAKGFDAIEPDNVDGYTNSTGFPLNYQDQLTFNTFIANEAHKRGLAVALKNDLDQIPDLLSSFDFALDEQCFQYSECDKLLPFVQSNKAVFEVEYSLATSKFCSKANNLNFNSMKKHLSLDAYRVACR